MDLVTAVGHAAIISAGEWVTASGVWLNDRTHGLQFKAHFLRTAAPSSVAGIEKYLGSGMIKGIGPVYAKRLAFAFGPFSIFDTVMEEAESAGADGIEIVRCDIRDRGAVERAVAGVDAVVNAVSLYVETPEASFRDVHVDAARGLAERARDAGVRRLVQISGIGASTDSASKYVRARGLGEQVVREAMPGTCIVRPSVVFSGNAGFTAALDAVTKLPVVPLFGRGRTRLQPVYVGDLARGIAAVLEQEGMAGKTFEFGGGAAYRYRDCVRLMMRSRDRRRPLLPVPFIAWRLLAAMMRPLRNPPLTPDQVVMMEHDNVVSGDARSLTDLGIRPRNLEQVLESEKRARS